jgi:hypothetical protein
MPGKHSTSVLAFWGVCPEHIIPLLPDFPRKVLCRLDASVAMSSTLSSAVAAGLTNTPTAVLTDTTCNCNLAACWPMAAHAGLDMQSASRKVALSVCTADLKEGLFCTRSAQCLTQGGGWMKAAALHEGRELVPLEALQVCSAMRSADALPYRSSATRFAVQQALTTSMPSGLAAIIA